MLRKSTWITCSQAKTPHCVVLALLLCTAACGRDECKLGESRCIGDAVETCEASICTEPGCALGQSNRWRIDTCRGTCVSLVDAAPFCSLLTAPDPRCGDGSGYCDGDTYVQCSHGFQTYRTDCRLSIEGTCLTSDFGEAFCGYLQDMDPDAGATP